MKRADTITVTRNETLYALNKPEQFILAIVLVEGDRAAGPYYVERPFSQEPDIGVTSVNYRIEMLLARAHSIDG